MKTFNTYQKPMASLMLAALLATLFISCGDDDDSGPPVNPDLPVINTASITSVDENKENASLVSIINATTPDFPDEEITFGIEFGNESGAFELDATSGELLVADQSKLNYESIQEFVLTITATNSAGPTTQDITIKVNDLEDERYLEYTHADNPENPGTTNRAGVRVSYGTDEWHVMDIWEPILDTETNRPVILFAGGGRFGDPTHKAEFWSMANNMSQRGYVAAYVYFTRVNDGCGLTGCNNELTPTTSEFLTPYFQNIQDLRGAVRFLRKNADLYGINPDQVYVGGWSTGGNIMFQSAMMGDNYQSNSDSPEINTIIDNVIAALGGVDGDLNPGYSSEINAIMTMMTTTYDLSMIDGSDPPLLLVNHEDASTGSDCQSGDKRIGSYTVEFPDGLSVTNHGTDPVFDAAQTADMICGDKKFIVTDVELTEDMDYGYLLMTGGPTNGGFCPNSSVLTSANYNFIANFYYRVTKGK